MEIQVIPEGAKICPELVPAAEMRNLCRDIMAGVKSFFEVPENQAAFEEWKRKRYGDIAQRQSA